jgi:hypothetical protein
MRRMTVVLVLVIALAGCNTATGRGNGTSGPAGAATGTWIESPELSRTEAAQRYLAAVRPYNEALEDFEDAVNTGQPLGTQQELAARTAEALAQEIADLRTVAWPADVAPHIEALVAESERALPHWQQAAEAASVEDLLTAVHEAVEFSGTGEAAAVREILDLDEYDEDDY